jgi:hypothetical protein
MSADNYASCPRCVRRAGETFHASRVRVSELYGKVPISEFMELMRKADSAGVVFRDDYTTKAEQIERTFREDYEFYGAEDGAVVASYRGECSVCGLKLSFEDRHEIPGVDE